MIYIAQAIILCLAGLVFCSGKINIILSDKKSNKRFLAVVFTMFAIVIGFRDLSVGSDTHAYYNIYNTISGWSWKSIFDNLGFFINDIEIGWILCSKTFSSLSLDYYAFQLVYSVVYVCLAANFIGKSTSNVFIATVIFIGNQLIYYPTNGQRQAIATMILINGWLFLKEDKKLKAFLFIILAALFHITALIYILIFILYWFKEKHLRVLYKLIPVVISIFLFFTLPILEFLNNYLGKYSKYLKGIGTNERTLLIYPVLAVISVIALYSIYFCKNTNYEYNIYCILSLVYVFFQLIGYEIKYFDRFTFYFVPFVVLLYIEFGNHLNKKTQLLYFTGLVVCHLGLYLRIGFIGTDRVYSTYLFA